MEVILPSILTVEIAGLVSGAKWLRSEGRTLGVTIEVVIAGADDFQGITILMLDVRWSRNLLRSAKYLFIHQFFKFVFLNKSRYALYKSDIPCHKVR
jgi:hypothetical protein